VFNIAKMDYNLTDINKNKKKVSVVSRLRQMLVLLLRPAS
jgi:hypothetical protein